MPASPTSCLPRVRRKSASPRGYGEVLPRRQNPADRKPRACRNLLDNPYTREEANRRFGFKPEKLTILILGGSLGARTLNETLMGSPETIYARDDVQFIWQTGKIYIDRVKARPQSLYGR